MNKYFLASFVLLLALSGSSLVQAQDVTLSCDTAILNKLKASAGTEFADVFHAQPQESTSETCKLQWGLNKTCCNPARITALAEKLFTAWRDRVDGFVKKLDNIEKDLVPRAESAGVRLSELNSKVTANEQTLTTRIGAALKDKAKAISSMSNKITEQIRPENFSKGKTEFLKNIKDCFDTIKTFRSGALCGICSGNSAAFIANGKAKITEDTCVKITSACAKSWQFMFETMQILKAVETVSKVEQAISQTGNTPIAVDQDLTKLTAEETGQLIDDLRTVSALRPEAIVINDLVRGICRKMLTVDSDPNPNLDGDVTRVEKAVQIEKEVQTKEAALPEQEKKILTDKIESAKRLRTTEETAKVTTIAIKKNLLMEQVATAESFMQTAAIEINTKKTEIEAARQSLKSSTTTPEAKLQAEAIINQKIGDLNNKILTLEAKKTEIQTTINDAVKLCPLSGCSDIRTVADTFSRKVAENSPQLNKAVESERVKVAEEMKLQLADMDAQIKTQAVAAQNKKAEFEQALVNLQRNPTDATAKTQVLAKMAELKLAGDALNTKVTTKNAKVTQLITKNSNTFGAAPKLLDETMTSSVQTIKTVQESVKLSSTVDLTTINTLLISRDQTLLNASTPPPDYSKDLTSFGSIGTATDLRQIIKPPTITYSATGTTTTGSTTGTTTGSTTGSTTGTTTGSTTGTNTGSTTGTNTGPNTGSTTGTNTGSTTGTNTGSTTGTNTGPNTGSTTGTNTGSTTGSNTGSTTTTQNPPKPVRILQTVDGSVDIVANGVDALSYPTNPNEAVQVSTTLNIAQPTQTTQGETTNFARAASILAVMVFSMIATVY